MAEATATWVGKPVWVDLSSGQPEKSRDFYASLFGWRVEVSPDPAYGGYATAMAGHESAAGIGPKMMPEAPTAWSVYIGTSDADETTRKVQAAGGTVIAPPMQVGDQGRMAVYQDPIGAYISVWQPAAMRGFASGGDNTFGWTELNARGLNRALAFYRDVFGWSPKTTTMEESGEPYTEFQLEGQSVAGGMDLPTDVPADVPSHWLVIFAVADVDASLRKAIELGATKVLAAMDFALGRFAEVLDPQGAAFGMVKLNQPI